MLACTGPTPDLVALARDADVLLAEATFPERVRPADNAPMLTHLWPDSAPADSLTAASQAFAGTVDVATPGLVADLGP